MCLVVLVPLVSQLIVSAHAGEPVAALCSAAPTSGSGHHTDDPLSACCYCNLLATHATLPSVAPVVAPMLLLPVVIAVVVLFTRFTPIGAFPSGRPRDPPVFSRA